MIVTTLTFWDVFHNLSIVDGSFRICPSDDEWDKAWKIAKFLKPFYDILILFSSTQYPIATYTFMVYGKFIFVFSKRWKMMI